ncbi:hypothetical protein DMH01_15810 [Amycolatopsis sp. WAC 04182]|nr:hypothetical protein DMH01_15810 [Amycolatopsis sp. WAC 04182]
MWTRASRCCETGVSNAARNGAAEEATNEVRRTVDQATTAPRALRPALTGTGAWTRPHRFAATADHSTLTIAAGTLDIDLSTLLGQSNRLEHDLGGQLLTRAERNQPMQVTPLGGRIITVPEVFGPARPSAPLSSEKSSRKPG